MRSAGMVRTWSNPFAEVIEATAWAAVIDARMRKRAVPERQRGIAPLTIGLGPNFIAGDTVDLAIETMWGERLGAIIETGATLPLGGEPRPIGGIGRARFVYAPVAGRFKTRAHIGGLVEDRVRRRWLDALRGCGSRQLMRPGPHVGALLCVYSALRLNEKSEKTQERASGCG